MTLKPEIAALNDRQRFNSQEAKAVLNTSVASLESTQDSDLRAELREVSGSRSAATKSDVADDMISHIEDLDITSYQQYCSRVKESDVKIATILDEGYPQKLKSISDPPLCIYVRGDESATRGGITVVGTRSATDHRIRTARKIARTVVNDLNTTVISGLANGVDEAAHEGAIEAKGRTVAVLPGEINKVKPRSNSDLGKRISKNGALLSEVSDQTGFHKGRYLERNRITSGLSDAVVVVASKDSGGTIKQAELAEAQGKPRFVYRSPHSDGQTPEKLVQESGFQEFESVEELINMISDSSENSVDNRGNLTFNNF